MALHDADGALAVLRATLKRYGLATAAPVYVTNPVPSEEELLQDQVRNNRNAGRSDLPNQGSWAPLELAGYTPESAVSLTQALQALPFVRAAELVSTTGAVGSV